ncbi:carboxymuconolactone decarboxylase family protein [Candidatus Palauibacter sp.]|uniref:carboxymuconolactone decarboxylase family protein n=1 Tax=Candidatus Palauibacter sp. TaxID=3101350 RepID=UPI003B01DB05
MAALAADHTEARLDEADRAMLDYAARLTLAPGEIAETDVAPLKTHGFDDLAIHDICAITGYYAFVNRLADGLGVELEHGKG